MIVITLTEQEAKLLKDVLQWSESFSTDDEEVNKELPPMYAKLQQQLAGV